MDEIIAMGWTPVKRDHNFVITEKDLKSVFKMVDMNKNGVICKIVSALIFGGFFLDHVEDFRTENHPDYTGRGVT